MGVWGLAPKYFGNQTVSNAGNAPSKDRRDGKREIIEGNYCSQPYERRRRGQMPLLLPTVGVLGSLQLFFYNSCFKL